MTTITPTAQPSPPSGVGRKVDDLADAIVESALELADRGSAITTKPIRIGASEVGKIRRRQATLEIRLHLVRATGPATASVGLRDAMLVDRLNLVPGPARVVVDDQGSVLVDLPRPLTLDVTRVMVAHLLDRHGAAQLAAGVEPWFTQAALAAHLTQVDPPADVRHDVVHLRQLLWGVIGDVGTLPVSSLGDVGTGWRTSDAIERPDPPNEAWLRFVENRGRLFLRAHTTAGRYRDHSRPLLRSSVASIAPEVRTVRMCLVPDDGPTGWGRVVILADWPARSVDRRHLEHLVWAVATLAEWWVEEHERLLDPPVDRDTRPSCALDRVLRVARLSVPRRWTDVPALVAPGRWLEPSAPSGTQGRPASRATPCGSTVPGWPDLLAVVDSGLDQARRQASWVAGGLVNQVVGVVTSRRPEKPAVRKDPSVGTASELSPVGPPAAEQRGAIRAPSTADEGPARATRTNGGILLGSPTSVTRRQPVGFVSSSRHASSSRDQDLWFDRSEAHALVVAPTGAGKTTWLACQLADHRGSAVVVDPKGELAAITARRRRELGNEVVVLDPFGQTADFANVDGDGAFDPGHWLTSSPGLEDDARSLAAEINAAPNDPVPFWPSAATALTAALITHVYDPATAATPSWASVATLLYAEDFDRMIERWVHTGTIKNPTARTALACYLNHPEVGTRPSVLSVARDGMAAFTSPQVARAVDRTTFDPSGIATGDKPLTMYLVLGPDKVVSHNALARLWITAVLQALTDPRRARARTPRSEVLFLIDELPALGPMAAIPTLYSYYRSFGVRAVAIVQSLAQLEAAYGHADATVLRENAGLKIAFGIHDRSQAEAVASLLDTTPDRLLATPRDHMMAHTTNDGLVACRRANHLEPVFVPAAWFDPNPYHQLDR